MTPIQLAQQECANYDKGICLGVDLLGDLRSRPLWTHRPTRCVIHDGKQCRYLSAIVIQAAKNISRDEKKETEWKHAASVHESLPIATPCL